MTSQPHLPKWTQGGFHGDQAQQNQEFQAKRQLKHCALYLDQCPRQPLVPIYLLVLSAVSLLLLLLGCVSCKEGGSDWPRALAHHLRVTCLLFLCAWFIAGSVWVYSIYPPDFEAKGPHGRAFCQRTLFLFAFGVTTALHAALAAALFFSLCLLGAVFLFGVLLPHGGHGDRGGP
nr:transmembrane protein 272-like [Anolis sagrei ordinatus]